MDKLVKKLQRHKRIAIPVAIVLFLLLIAGIVLAVVLVTNQLGNREEQFLSNDPGSSDQNIGQVTNDTPSCSLPIVEYKSNAFSIGVPKGWMYKVDSGTVSIMQDDTNTTAAFLYTAKLNEDLSTEEFLGQFVNIFRATIEDVGGTFDSVTRTTTDDLATADIQAIIGSDTMSGKMIIDKSEGFVTLRSYWAPVGEIQAQEPVLEEVVNCFARTRILTDEIIGTAHQDTGVLLEDTTSGMAEYVGNYFKLDKPDNFTVTAESDSGIDLTRSDGNAGFSYAYATGFTGVYTPRSWAERALPEFAGISSLSLSEGRDIPSPINGQVIQELDFSGYLNGSVSVVGKVTVGIYSTPYIGFGEQYTSAFWGIEIATPSAWDEAKDTLQAIQDSIEIIDIGATRKNTLLPPNRPIESVSSSRVTGSSSYSESKEKSSEDKWADSMRGYETVESPSTGERMDVPQNSWSSYGPEGEGYYRLLPDDSLEKLNQTY